MSIFPREKTPLEKEICILYQELRTARHTEEYDAMLEKVIKLEKLAQERARKPISSDALLTAGVNLLGILMILKHEELNVITSKALPFIAKTKM